jgi:hypothetical protein
MRILIPLFFAALLFALPACVEGDPQCDFEDDVSCTCDDGATGELECNDDGTANCICGDDENDE